MKRRFELKRLDQLDREADSIRKRLGISRAGEILYQAPQGNWSDNDVIVEAAGDGTARLLIVEGNYPIDYLIKKERLFATEDEACESADQIVA